MKSKFLIPFVLMAALCFAGDEEDPKGNPEDPPVEECCPENSEIQATFTSNDPKTGSVTSGGIPVPNISLGKPNPNPNLVDGKILKCVEVGHTHSCANSVIQLYALGAGETDYCVDEEGNSVKDHSHGVKLAWDSEDGCVDETDPLLFHFFPKELPENGCAIKTITLTASDSDEDCQAGDDSQTTNTKIQIWKPKDDTLTASYRTWIPGSFLQGPALPFFSPKYYSGDGPSGSSSRVLQSIGFKVCQFSYEPPFEKETYTGATGHTSPVGKSGVFTTGVTQTVSATSEWNQLYNKMPECSAVGLFSGDPDILNCQDTASDSGLTIDVERIHSSYIKLTFNMNASNPCVWSCSITGSLELEVRYFCDPNESGGECVKGAYRLSGEHAEFPNHDFKFRGASVPGFPFDVCAFNSSVISLCSSSSRLIDTGWKFF